MKKFLSLVLALVMTMSLVTVGAGAKDFTDAEKVNYNEAIDVMSTLKVIEGYDDGSINPQGSLTRGAAAKIICNLVLGPTDAAALKVTDAPYSDVPANSTFAGYIAYCKSAGYVSGYADGSFKPGAPLTGYAFMKMLLCTLGLDKNIEGYEGNNWSVNVAKRALNLELASGLKDTFNGTKAINREEAMLFAFNTLKAKTFTYDDKGTNITLGGITVNTGASDAEQGANTLYYTLFKNDLVPNTVTDDFGRPATKWTYKNKAIGTYADTAKKTYTAPVTEKALFTDISPIEENSVSFKLYDNGVYTADATVNKADDTNCYGGNGIITEVFYKYNTASKTKILQITPAIAKVTEVAKDDDGRYVMVATGAKFYTEDFAKGDYLVYLKSAIAGKDIASAYAVEKQSGTITKITTSNEGTALYIDGVKYLVAAYVDGDASTLKAKDKVDFYVDANGYIAKVSKTSSSVTTDDVAVVVNVGGGMKDKGWNKVIFVGDKKATTIDTAEDYSSTYALKTLVKYELDEGLYELEEVGTYYDQSVTFTKGNAGISVTGGTVKVDGSTTFMLINSKNEASYFTGIKNCKTFTSSGMIAYFKDNDSANAAVLVVGYTDDANTTSDDLTFVVNQKDPVTTKEDGKTYVTFKTLAGDDITVNTTLGLNYNNSVYVAESYTTNSKGVVTLSALNSTNYYRVDTVKAPENGVITLGNDVKVLADKVAVYTITTASQVVTSDLDAIIDQDSKGLYYNEIVATCNDDGEIDVIILSLKN